MGRVNFGLRPFFVCLAKAANELKRQAYLDNVGNPIRGMCSQEVWVRFGLPYAFDVGGRDIFCVVTTFFKQKN